jgi:hypothetical protein
VVEGFESLIEKYGLSGLARSCEDDKIASSEAAEEGVIEARPGEGVGLVRFLVLPVPKPLGSVIPIMVNLSRSKRPRECRKTVLKSSPLLGVGRLDGLGGK